VNSAADVWGHVSLDFASVTPLGGALVAGFGLRALYRRLPVGGPLAAALVAYAGTRALGEVRTRIAP